MRLLRAFIVAIAATSVVPAASARVGYSDFARWDDAGVTGLAYEFDDADGRRHRIAFSLPTASVDAALQGFARFDPKAVDARSKAAYRRQLEREVDALRRRYPQATIEIDAQNGLRLTVRPVFDREATFDDVLTLLRREAAKLSRDYPDVDFNVRDDGRISYRGRMDKDTKRRLDNRLKAATLKAERLQRRRVDQAEAGVQRDHAALKREIERAFAAARTRAEAAAAREIADQGYAPRDRETVVPNYARIARAGANALADALPAFKRLTAGLDRRAAIDRLLAFFQSIPYDTLTSRTTSGTDAGFALPVALLARNRGDCDTKSVAFASVLNRLYPDMAIGLLLLDDHALIALDTPARRGDRTLNADGRTWVLAEPVGPARAKLGWIGDQTRRQIGNRPQLLRLF